MATPLIAGMEIGTSRTVVCVGEFQENGKLHVLGVGTYPSTGVRKGQIIDLTQAKVCVEAAVRQAEKAADVSIWEVLIAISGGHIQAKVNPGIITLGDGTVTAEDMEEVKEIASALEVEEDRQILHTIKQSFTVDDQPGIIRPEGMRCKMLKLDMLAVHGLKNRVDNVINVAMNSQLNVKDVAFSGICSALSALSPTQKRNGVVLIDLGGGTTNYVAFCNNVLSAAGSIGVGGDHINNDIALAFNISLSHAEEIKHQEGSALVDEDSAGARVALPTEVGFEPRSISRKALHTVINARMDETLRVLRSKLDDAGVLPHLGGGIVLTGGGAYLKKVPELARHVFGLPCCMGTVQDVTGIEQQKQPASLATAIGLVQYGYMTYMAQSGTGIMTKIKRLFKK